MARGFVWRRDGGEYVFHAPDAGVLASAAFQDRHCHSLVVDRARSITGIRFDSKGEIKPSDVWGVIWLKPGTYEPDFIDFRYTGLSFGRDNDQTCGRLDLGRMETGEFFVKEWWIRVPSQVQRRTIGMDHRGRILMRIRNAAGETIYQHSSPKRVFQRIMARDTVRHEVPGSGDPYRCVDLPS
jgi:hypothetical protein